MTCTHLLSFQSKTGPPKTRIAFYEELWPMCYMDSCTHCRSNNLHSFRCYTHCTAIYAYCCIYCNIPYGKLATGICEAISVWLERWLHSLWSCMWPYAVTSTNYGIYTVVCAADTGTSTNYGIYTEYHNIFNLVSPSFVCRFTCGNSSGQPSSFIHTTQNGVQLVKILPSCRNALLVA